MPDVVITLPAYRAESTLAKTVADIPASVGGRLLLVDDASPDATVRVAEQLGIRVHVHPENRGYGGNQKTCYTEALRDGADIVVMLHPDYQYDPKAVPLLIAPILAGDADLTFGSRFAGLGDPMGGGMPFYRFAGNRITTTLENLMLGSRFTDLHSGMRAYTRECLLALPFLRYSNDFSFDSEMIVDAVTNGQRVVEVPIPTRYTKESSSIQVGASLRYIRESIAYTARRTLTRGRRGSKNPVTWRPRRVGPALGTGPSVTRGCVLCGDRDHRLVYPANVTGDVPLEEFRCTTSALSQHDDIVQCARCGLVSSVPDLSANEIVTRYKQVEDPVYLDEEPERRELFSWFVDAMAGFVTPGRDLLEVGSNVGLYLDVARSRGWNVRGVEPSAWAVNEGVERFGVDLRQGTVEELTEDDGSADAVVMLDVLEHVNDPLAALRRVRRVVKDEGLLVLSTVDVTGLHAKVRKGSWPWFIRSHLWYFSPQTLSAMLREAGFRMVEWSVVPRSFHLSYLAHRAGASLGAVGRTIEEASRVADVKVPVGWLGDVIFVAARPITEQGEG